MERAIGLCNAALIKLGAGTIVSFDDQSAEARVAGRLYPLTRDALLSLHPWRFDTTDEEAFPAHFTAALVSRLAAEFCLPLTENVGRTERLARFAEAELKVAKLVDGQHPERAVSGQTKRVVREPTGKMVLAGMRALGGPGAVVAWETMYDAAPDADAGRVADCQCGKFPVHLTAERFQQAIETEEKLAELELRIERALAEYADQRFSTHTRLDNIGRILRGETP